MSAITRHALRATLRLALIAFVAGLLLGTAATIATAAPPDDTTLDLSAAQAATHTTPAAPTTPGGLTICPAHADCDDDEPVDPTPHDGAGDITTCPQGVDCGPDDDGPGGFTTCPEDQDCSPDEPTDDPGDDPGDDPVDHDPRTVDGVPVPTRIETGLGGTAPSMWSWALLGDALLALAAGGTGAYLGTRL